MLPGSGFLWGIFFTRVSVITFPPVASSTVFCKQCVMVICLILLARPPGALTRLHGCCPQVLLVPTVWWGEGLLLPMAPGCPKEHGGESRGPRRSLVLLVAAEWGCSGRDGAGQALWLPGGLSMDYSDLKGCRFSLEIVKFSCLPFLNLFAVRDFKSNVFPHTFLEKADLHMH